MQDRITPCIIEEQSCLADFTADQMISREGLRELVDLGEQLAHGHVRIHDVADRIASLLSHGLPDDIDEDEDVVSSTTGSDAMAVSLSTSSSSSGGDGGCSDSDSDSDSDEGREVASHTLAAADASAAGLEEALLLAGYTDCMREALRFLVEEESFAAHDPLVLGLRQHLLDHQPRLPLVEVRPPSL
ncbi:uncharacterized protein LOC126160746 [Schistocerca cancellata]|uniref:uncharacterized protein LOC126160746 n=1 Tax=Schistocerca cancellata TaxID=274614 RepID=UPI0021187B8A|nr:uncharacterized protein LOC126160746 [Schistocerca cancellata]